MKCLKFVVFLLLVIGALNWGLVGFFQYDLVVDVFGGAHTTGARVIYCLIGVAGLLSLKCLCRSSGCSGGSCDCGPSCGCGCGPKK